MGVQTGPVSSMAPDQTLWVWLWSVRDRSDPRESWCARGICSHRPASTATVEEPSDTGLLFRDGDPKANSRLRRTVVSSMVLFC